MRHYRLLLCLMGALLAGCAGGIDGKRYLGDEPRLDLFEFFTGDVIAWGVVQGRDGNILQRFKVDITGTVSGNTLTLDERFDYRLGDGVKHRVWTIERQADGSYTGRAGDILGTAEGTAYGNAFQWRYQMDLPVDDSSYRVNFDDWFWAVTDDTLVNRSTISKFGIDFAEVTLFMQRQSR